MKTYSLGYLTDEQVVLLYECVNGVLEGNIPILDREELIELKIILEVVQDDEND